MSKRVYTLELSADDLRSVEAVRGRNYDIGLMAKLYHLADQAKFDREADELRLPWIAIKGNEAGGWWHVGHNFHGDLVASRSERAAKLMSAAPELLEAVKACKQWIDEARAGTQPAWFGGAALPAIERALRKVETGVPE